MKLGAPNIGRKGEIEAILLNKLTKLSSAPKTTLGRIIIESGKFLVTKISPFNLDLAYLEFFILLTPSADK